MNQLGVVQTRVSAVGRKRHEATRGAMRERLHEIAASLVGGRVQIHNSCCHGRPRVEMRPERRAPSSGARVVAPKEGSGRDEVVSARTRRNPSTDLECSCAKGSF